jgi:hypothetical protein
MARDWYEEALKKAEEGKMGGTLSKSRPEGEKLPRPTKMSWPWQEAPRMGSTYPSKAPAGMANAVKGDLGMYRGQEADKQKGFKADGRTGACAKKLYYGEPDMAIDAKYGPGDKIC